MPTRKMDSMTGHDWSRFNAQSELGACLMKRKAYSEAEKLLTSGYEGLKTHQSTLPDGNRKLLAALDRLIEFAAAAKKAEDVTKWQTERALLNPK